MRCVVVSCCNVSPIARSGSALAQAVEDLPIQHFIAEAGVEALAIAILLGHVDKWRIHRRIEVMSMKPRKLWAVLS